MATNLSLSDISGDIENTLSSVSLTQDDKSRLQTVKQWFVQRRSEVRPWSEFLNAKRFSKPKNVAEISKRVIGNIKLYQSNYVMVCLLLITYCIITSPLLLFGLSMSFGGCYYISTRGKGQSIKLFGRQLSVPEQYGLIFLISLPLFFLASAGSIVFWIIGASIFVIVVHASLLAVTPSSDEITDLEMQGIDIQ